MVPRVAAPLTMHLRSGSVRHIVRNIFSDIEDIKANNLKEEFYENFLINVLCKNTILWMFDVMGLSMHCGSKLA